MRAVQDHYANLTVVTGPFVYFRGVTVEIREKTIREVLVLPEVENDWEDAIGCVPNKHRLSDTIKKALCRNHIAVEWSLDKYGCPEEFLTKHLTDHHRGWFNLFCTNIMPTKSHQFVSVDRALLLFAIINNITIDFASIICQQMEVFTVDEKERGWFFPSLLTRLMERSGVNFRPHDESSLLPLPWSLQGSPPDYEPLDFEAEGSH
ncbi:OLC1v1024605C1 [Oldenlandia corymbosa var. corymbosa]|uniref:OLC1v1024605C1 n=1 Tax=Oldenlandia corymbosa var. corymbosa TaxID=529605 RepID=A0AAV1C5L5_OLDCO|nr:OLC1v1024605C1 [Oldenlandia corymbosa var. corymbosa]